LNLVSKVLGRKVSKVASITVRTGVHSSSATQGIHPPRQNFRTCEVKGEERHNWVRGGKNYERLSRAETRGSGKEGSREVVPVGERGGDDIKGERKKNGEKAIEKALKPERGIPCEGVKLKALTRLFWVTPFSSPVERTMEEILQGPCKVR